MPSARRFSGLSGSSGRMTGVPFFPSRRRAGALLCAVVLTFLAAVAGSSAGAAPTMPTAQPSAGLPTVGPLFANGLGRPHTCTAKVVHSARHDLLLTAAHCVPSSGGSLLFVPGYLA